MVIDNQDTHRQYGSTVLLNSIPFGHTTFNMDTEPKDNEYLFRCIRGALNPEFQRISRFICEFGARAEAS